MSDEIYKRRRTVVKGQLTSFQNYLKKFDKNPSRLMELEVRLEKAESLWHEYNEAQMHLEVTNEKGEVDTSDREKFESAYFETIAYAKGIARSMQPLTSEASSAATHGTHTNNRDSPDTSMRSTDLKLPSINLPTFSGEYGNWMSFRDVFKDLIDLNTSLSDTQKLHYLKSSVTGKAALVIQSIEITAPNYQVAWGILVDRFENTRLIIHHHVQSILDLDPMTKESHTSLRKIIDDVRQHLRVLGKLDQPIQHWDTLLIHLLVPKLDLHTKREWEFKREATTLPTMQEFMTFLTKRCEILENLSSLNRYTSKDVQTVPETRGKAKRTTSLMARDTSNKPQCCCCKGNHMLYACETFRELPVSKRIDQIKRWKRCLNCLRDHSGRECTLGGCKVCQGRHNTLLHCHKIPEVRDTNVKEPSKFLEQPPVEQSPEISNGFSHCAIQGSPQVLLSTAIIIVRDVHNKPQECRALLDSASQSHFMSRKLFSKLQLKKTEKRQVINGIGQSDTKAMGVVKIHAQARHSNHQFQLQCLILDNVTGSLPQRKVDTCKFEIPQGIQLADPTFDTPGQIDLLIGASMFYELLCNGRIKLGKQQPILQNTKLGWIVGGVFTPCKPNSARNAVQCCLSMNTADHEQLEKFWKVEEIGTSRALNKEEQFCEDHFASTYERTPEGRFVVKLPLTEDPSKLGESFEIAKKRLLSVEKRLTKSTETKESYHKFLEEYQSLGHMDELHEAPSRDARYVYLPHHPVVKDTSITTKLRVVFDASCKTSNGRSINEILAVGPTIQDDLFAIVLRFREHQYVISADIVKMYRQILIHPEHRHLQCILWRSPSGNLAQFALNTVTYGMSSSPFLAIRCLRQLAMDHQDVEPAASAIIKRDFYVDDLLTGADDLKHLTTLNDKVTNILHGAGFALSKWCSNHDSLIPTPPEPESIRQIGEEVKTLGLMWNTRQDTFQYKTNRVTMSSRITKRQMLSAIAQIFDPLGLLGPAIVKGKLMLQHLWSRNIDWDTHLPQDLCDHWVAYAQQLHALSDIKISRWVLCSNPTDITLHCFSDASEKAYGTCIYICTTDALGTRSTRLLCAKSRVAPLKQISLPRLELCAAQLAAQLYQKVKEASTRIFHATYFWTDSTICLAWIHGNPSRWLTFVANRVAEIQRLTDPNQWRHVRSQHNPADVISRGADPADLGTNRMWWQGPMFLQISDVLELTPSEDIAEDHDTPEECHSADSFTATIPNDEWFSRFSTLNRMKRVFAYCLRFIYNSTHPTSRNTGSLKVEELNHSLTALIRLMQSREFPIESRELKAGRHISPGSKLNTLHPFLDDERIIRVGGRLHSAAIPYTTKFPIVLASKNELTRLIILDAHHRALHAGPQALLAMLREQYWPMSARSTIRSVLRHCITCFRARPHAAHQLMGSLPSIRVTRTRAFCNVGVDYAGPIPIKISRNKSGKAYLCVFICMATKAIHLEIASDLSTDSFLKALKRFIARRGKCATIYSDNGRNFVGARNELRALYELLTDQKHQTILAEFLANQSIQWSLIPPYSPHVGGLWEAAVKSAKTHLKKVVGTTTLSFEELDTVMTQIEACLNSRPLHPLSEDPSDLNALTPGHFLIGTPLTAIPEPAVTEERLNHLSRYQLLTRLQQDFWKRWHRDYLTQLQQRNKWKHASGNATQPGTMVLLRDDHLPPLCWRLGRITRTYPGKDQLVRVVDVRTSTGVVQRTLPKICILPICTPSCAD